MVLRDSDDKVGLAPLQHLIQTARGHDVMLESPPASANPLGTVQPSALPQGVTQRFVVVDFRSQGFMHQEYNLALLRYLLFKYPYADIHFLGQPDYARDIKTAIADQRLHAHDLNVLTRHRFNAFERLETFIRSARSVWQTLRVAGRLGADRIYVLGSDSFLLYFFRKLNAGGRFEVRHLFHGDIAAHFIGWQPRNPITRHFRLPRQMSLGGGERSHFVFLEQPIIDSVRSHVVSIGSPCSVFPHPMPRRDLLPGLSATPHDGPVRIAFAGVARRDKGFDVVLEISRRIRSERVELFAVGARGSEYRGVTMEGIARGPFDEAISIEEYHRLLAMADYVILPADPRIYAFVGSSSFHDAVFQGKPILGLRSNYLSLLEGRFGPFGVLFDEPEALQEFIVNWQSPQAATYAAWKHNLERIRLSREPAQLAASCDF